MAESAGKFRPILSRQTPFGRALRLIARIFGILFIVAVGFVYWAFQSGRALEWARARVITTLHDRCEVDAKFQKLTIDPFPPVLEMKGLELSHLDGRPILSVEDAIVTLRMLPLFAQRLQLDRVAVLAPKATIELENGRVLNLPKCVAPSSGKTSAPIVLGITELTVERGSFDLRIDQRFEAKLDGIGISLTARSVGGGSDLAIGVDGVSLLADARPLPIERFRYLGRIEGLLTDPRVVVIDSLEIAMPPAKLSATGNIDLFGPVYDAEVDLEMPIAMIRDFVADFPKAEGQVHFAATVQGTSASPHARGTALVDHAVIDGHPLGDQVLLEVAADRSGAEIEALEVRLADGRLKAKGHLDFDEHLTVKLTTEADKISIARILDAGGERHAWVDWHGTGTSSFAGTIRSPTELKGTFDYHLSDFYVFDRGWDRPEVKDRRTLNPKYLMLHPGPVEVRGKVAVDAKGVSLTEVDIVSGYSNATADARINYANKDGIKITAHFPAFDFDDLGPIGGLRFGGKGSLTGVLSGPRSKLGASGSVDFQGTTIDGIPFGHARAEVVWHDDQHLDVRSIQGKLGETTYEGEVEVLLTGATPLSIDGRITKGRVEDVLVPFGVRVAEWGDPKGKVTGKFSVVGPIRALTGPIDLELGEASIVDEKFESGRARGRMDRGAILVDELVLDKHGAQINGSGKIDRIGNEIQAHIRSKDLTLQQIDLFKLSQPALDGKLLLDLALAGTMQGVTGTISAGLVDLAAGPLPLQGGRITGRIHGTSVAVQGRLLGDQLHIQGDVEIAKNLPYRNAKLDLIEYDVPKLIAALNGHLRHHGVVTAHAQLSGTLVQWYESSGKLQLERAHFDTESIHIETAGPSRLTLRQGVLETDRLGLVGPSTKLNVQGRLGSKVLDLKIAGRIDLAIAEVITPQIERSGGVLTIDSAIGGAPANMNLVGTGKVDGGFLQWRGFTSRLAQVSADLTFSQSTVLVERAEGRVADGRVTMTGSLVLSKFRIQDVALNVMVEDVSPRFTWPTVDLAGTVKGALQIGGTPNRLIVRGDLDVTRGEAKPKLEWQNLISKRRSTAGNVYDPSAEIMDTDIRFHLAKNFPVKNTPAGVDLELKGDVRLTGTNQRLGMLGSLSAIRGGTVTFLGRKYEMLGGTVDFQDRYRWAPRYDLQLTTDACSAQIRVNVVGTLENVDTTYTSNPAMDETNILSCLLRGVKVQDLRSAGVDQLPLGKISGLDREVRKVLPIDDLDVTTAYSTITRQYEPRVLVAKELTLLGGSARLEYSSSLVRSDDRSLMLRYRITPQLTLQGGWASKFEPVQPIVGDVGLDLKYRWEW